MISVPLVPTSPPTPSNNPWGLQGEGSDTWGCGIRENGFAGLWEVSLRTGVALNAHYEAKTSHRELTADCTIPTM